MVLTAANARKNAGKVLCACSRSPSEERSRLIKNNNRTARLCNMPEMQGARQTGRPEGIKWVSTAHRSGTHGGETPAALSPLKVMQRKMMRCMTHNM